MREPNLQGAGSVPCNGITLAYDSFGNDAAEPILLIAGLGTQMIRWTDMFCLELVRHGFRVVRFDNRDTGLSTRFAEAGAIDFAALAEGRLPNLAYTLDDMAADAVGLLDALAIEKAHIVGRSMGGMIAQLVAAEYSSRVGSLTSIMSSTGNPGLPPPAPDAMALMIGPAPDPVTEQAAFIDHSVRFARRIAGSGFPFDEAEYRALIHRELSRGATGAGIGRQIAAIAASGDRRDRLAAITAPSLVIHGTEDPLFPLECGADTARSIRDAEWLPIEGMGHDLPAPLFQAIAEAIVRTARC